MSKDSKAYQPKGKLLSFHPTGEYYFAKGLKAYQRRDFYKSKKYLERAIQLEPGEPMIYCQLAIVCTELGDYQQSNRYLHEILEELDEHMLECHYFLANNYAHLGLFKDAYTHASLYLKLDQDGEFVEDTEELIDLLTLEAEELEEDLYEEDDLIVKQDEARRLLESGHFPRAVDLLEEVIEEFPEYWSAYNNLALAYFYLGETSKADDILEDVLTKNPGNLHALCNKLVFAFYLKDKEKVNSMKEVLKKIKPMLQEHQFKLGASFALVGEYELAFGWLRKLQRVGFDGDGPFYYWLSYSAYHTNRQSTAEQAWKKVLEFSPEKEGHEPWEKNKPEAAGFEHIPKAIHQKLESSFIEERLFGLFLASLSDEKENILASFKQPKYAIEKEYADLLSLEACDKPILLSAHETAMELYKQHQPIGTTQSSLFLLWFTILPGLMKENVQANNSKALAAATEYMWRKQRGERTSQQQVAKLYSLSSTTLQKYVKIVKGLI